MQFTKISELLQFAITKEQEAADFYADLAARSEAASMREVFDGFALEELKHKAKLQDLDHDNLLEPSARKILDLKLADYLEDEAATKPDTYQDALILAMNREKQSFRLYQDLAKATDNPKVRTLLLGLAHEEASHKLRIELEYETHFMQEN